MGKSLKELQQDFKLYSSWYPNVIFLCSDFSKFECANDFKLLRLCPERLLRMLLDDWDYYFVNSEKPAFFRWLLE